MARLIGALKVMTQALSQRLAAVRFMDLRIIG
jgi:hypothetical protein